MRRILLAVTGTIAGLVALLSFKTHSPVTNSAPLPSAGISGKTQSPATPSPSRSSSGKSPSRPSPSTKTRTPAAHSSTTRSYTGQAVNTPYGVVQVKVSVSGSKITNVSFVQLTAFDQHSQDINSQAAPILLQQTLSAQSAKIDGVSGATYTSGGYEQSLQSALDKAGI
jgi:uncharacterized protein with FMN-binding domain